MKFDDFDLDLTKVVNGGINLLNDGCEEESSGSAGSSGSSGGSGSTGEISANTSSDLISATCSCTCNKTFLCFGTAFGCA